MHGFEALFAADATLEALGTEIEDRAMDARLAALAADLVHRPEYLAEVVLDRARRLILLTQGLRIVRWHLVADDAVVFRAAIDALRAAVDELATGSLDGIDPSVGYRSAASTFLSAARAMAQRLDGEAFNERERHALGRGEVFGSPDRAVAAYNHLVDAYNHRLRR